MSVDWILRFECALSVRTRRETPYGEGFNCSVEFSGPAHLFSDEVRARLEARVRAIDHRSLGLDVDLKALPFLDHLATHLSVGESWINGVRLTRGDGVSVATGSLKRQY